MIFYLLITDYCKTYFTYLCLVGQSYYPNYFNIPPCIVIPQPDLKITMILKKSLFAQNRILFHEGPSVSQKFWISSFYLITPIYHEATFSESIEIVDWVKIG